MEHTKLQGMCLLVYVLIIMINSKVIVGQSQDSVGNNILNLTLLESAVSKGAVCLDGSPPAYYYDKGHGEGANNWMIFLRGGAWCTNVTDCLDRTKNEKGSSKLAMPQRPFIGVLSNNKTSNPDFYNWNRVQVIYCDGSSFTGDVEKVDPNTNLHYRGARIFLAIIEHFLEIGMNNAKNAILTGTSAGGLSTLIHCDRFRTLLPSSARVKCLVDGGYFLHIRKRKEMSYMETINEGLINLHHSAKMLPSSCTSKMKPSLCLFPQYIQEGIKTPFFLANSMFDSFQINVTYPDYYEHLLQSRCTATLDKNLQEFGHNFLSKLPKTDHASSRGMFISSCFIHAQTPRGDGWNGFTIHNKTLAEAFGEWFFNNSPIQLIDKSKSPLNCYQPPKVTKFCGSEANKGNSKK